MSSVTSVGDEDPRGPFQRVFDAIGAQLAVAEICGGDRPRLGENYEIHRIIGSGGFGLVCEAEQLNLRRRVALKLYPLGSKDDVGVRAALRAPGRAGPGRGNAGRRG